MLLIDAGNSRCKWAWVENGRCCGRARSTIMMTPRGSNWKLIFAQLETPPKILVSNVAGAAMAQRLRELCAVCHALWRLLWRKPSSAGCAFLSARGPAGQ